jgi:hypothetical protein
MKRKAMAKNVKPNRILIKPPMIGYTEFNNNPLSASSRYLLMKDKAPRETKPAPKTKSPALVDIFSKCLGVFMFGSGNTLIGSALVICSIIEVEALKAGPAARPSSGWQRDDLQLAG